MEEKKQREEYRDIELKLIDEPEGRIRIDANDDEIESLADNIKEVGQIQPIVLAKNGKRFEIIAGHRRFLAISRLGLKTIKAIVKEMSKVEIALVRASENLIRIDLSPIEEGATYIDLAQEHNMTIRQIGDKFGKAASTVKDKMDLTRLEPGIQMAIHERKISQVVGVALNQIDEPRERNKHLKYAIENGCTEEVALIWVKDFRRSSEHIDSGSEQGGSPGPMLETKKIYQACEICENPIEIQEMKIIRVCHGCYKIIAENLKQGS